MEEDTMERIAKSLEGIEIALEHIMMQYCEPKLLLMHEPLNTCPICCQGLPKETVKR